LDAAANLEAAHRYLRRLAAWDLAGVRSMYSSDVEQIEYPNRVSPDGARRDLVALIADAEDGRRQFSKHSYEVLGAMADGERVALEVVWRAELAVPLGRLPAGAELSSHTAIFLEFRHGRIVSQRNYDCFLPQKIG
jgi:ketosteroid isomerase-like protein